MSYPIDGLPCWRLLRSPADIIGTTCGRYYALADPVGDPLCGRRTAGNKVVAKLPVRFRTPQALWAGIPVVIGFPQQPYGPTATACTDVNEMAGDCRHSPTVPGEGHQRRRCEVTVQLCPLDCGRPIQRPKCHESDVLGRPASGGPKRIIASISQRRTPAKTLFA